MPDLKIAPSILAADFCALGTEVESVIEAGAEMIHVDVMDGHFAPNITIGPPVVASIRSRSEVPLDVHLMIENPEAYVESFADAGADIITFHIEAAKHPHRLVSKIHDLGCQAGVALNPGTSHDEIEFLAEAVDMVLVMTVNPGFGGQAFIPEMVQKIEYVRAMMGDRDVEVDGGIDDQTAYSVVNAGANVLVAGSYIYQNAPYYEPIGRLKSSAGE